MHVRVYLRIDLPTRRVFESNDAFKGKFVELNPESSQTNLPPRRVDNSRTGQRYRLRNVNVPTYHAMLRRGRDRPRMQPLPRLRHRMLTRLPPYRPRPVTAPAGSNRPISRAGVHGFRPWMCHDSRFALTVGQVPPDLERRCRLRVPLL